MEDGEEQLSFMNAIKHFGTITHHKFVVAKHCFRSGIYLQGLTHDLSKYSPAEFRIGVQYYTGVKSPNSVERTEKGYSSAWLHHKGRNRHHFEYWIDVKSNGDVTLEGKKMPTRYVVEMFCDRVAASKVYQGSSYSDKSSLTYYRLEQSVGPPLMHPDTSALLERLLIMLAKEGEKETFRYIRNEIVKKRYVEGEGGSF